MRAQTSHAQTRAGARRVLTPLLAVFTVSLLVAVGAVPVSAATTTERFYLKADEAVDTAPPAPDAPTLERYDPNYVPLVGASPFTWFHTPSEDTTIAELGGSVWFRFDETKLQTGVEGVHEAYHLAIARDGGLVTYLEGSTSANDGEVTSVQVGVVKTKVDTFSHTGAFRVDFPTSEVDVPVAAGETIGLYVLAYTSNVAMCITAPGTLPCELLDSDVAVLYGSLEHDSFIDLGFA